MSLKDEGNAEFRQGNWLKAAALYTKAIKADPANAVLYRSERCTKCACNPLHALFCHRKAMLLVDGSGAWPLTQACQGCLA